MTMRPVAMPCGDRVHARAGRVRSRVTVRVTESSGRLRPQVTTLTVKTLGSDSGTEMGFEFANGTVGSGASGAAPAAGEAGSSRSDPRRVQARFARQSRSCGGTGHRARSDD